MNLRSARCWRKSSPRSSRSRPTVLTTASPRRTIAAHEDAIAVVIPPRQDAVPSAAFETDPSLRDTHLLMISSLGRLRWQEITGYGQRALVETAIGRYKALIGEGLRGRGDAARRTEAVVGAAVLNRMLDSARPNSVRNSIIPA